MNEIDPNKVSKVVRKSIERRTLVSGECHIWTGQQWRGHGYVVVRGEIMSVARVVYALNRKLRPRQKVVHTCGNSLCINPSHLKQLWEDLE